MKVIQLLSLLFLAFGEILSQYPRILFRGDELYNHTFVNLTEVETSFTNSLRCTTDVNSCCRVNDIYHGGWYLPSGLVSWNEDDQPGIYVSHRRREVHLHNRNDPNLPSGIYYCDIPINYPLRMGRIYIGLYATGGDIVISAPITLSVISDLNGSRPQYILTCISTGGPATTVIWSRNLNTLYVGSKSELINRETAQYTHSLTVMGRYSGRYVCEVANDKPSSDTTSFLVKAAQAPTNIRAVRIGPTTIKVSWRLSSQLEDTTGYMIQYQGIYHCGDVVVVSRSRTETESLRNLRNGDIYTVSITATSEHFYSSKKTVYSVGLVPDKPTITTTSSKNSISLLLSAGGDSVVTSYDLTWTSHACSGYTRTTTYASNYVISNLSGGTAYNITASAKNLAGYSPISRVTAVIPERAPSAAPLVEVSIISSTAISVQWKEVECLDRNGIILRYALRYKNAFSSQTIPVLAAPGVSGLQRKTVSGLLPVTKYTVEVAAETRAGRGVYSIPKTITTPDHQFFSHNGDIVPNHGYVVISHIGVTVSTALNCHTNRPPPIGGSHSGGDWFTPNSVRVSSNSDTGFGRRRIEYIIGLLRISSTTSPEEGIYFCVISDSANSLKTIYVGLYQDGYGDLTISSSMEFSVVSDLNGCTPQFTLTCITTGGPATSVTWTRDGAVITEGNRTKLQNTVTARYIHNLTVIGRREGLYKCTVANDKPSGVSQQLLVQAPPYPSHVSVSQNGIGSVRVSWTSVESGLIDLTGYIIFYQRQDGGVKLSRVAGNTDTEATIAGLVVGTTYYITVATKSNVLTSLETTAQTIIIEPFTIYITSSPSSIVAGQRVTLICSVMLPAASLHRLTFGWKGPDRTPLTPSTTVTSGLVVSSELLLQKITTSQAGEYTCTATLLGYNSSSKVVIVQIPVPKPIIESGTSRMAGTQLRLTCIYSVSESVDTHFQTVVSWIVNCSPLKVSDDRQDRIYASEDILRFSPLDVSDSGRYICKLMITSVKEYVAVLKPNQSEETAITVQDLFAPVVTISGKDFGISGEEVKLTCHMTTVDNLVSSAKRYIQWRRGNITGVGNNVTERKISIDGSSNTLNQTMIFNVLSTLHADEYICEAVVDIELINLTRVVTQSINVAVEIPMPIVEVSGNELVVASGSPLYLNCSIQPLSVDTPTMIMSSWTAPNSIHNSTYTVSNTSIELFINSVETTDSGNYTCSARVADSSRNNYIVDSEISINVLYINIYLYFKIHLYGEVSCSEKNKPYAMKDITNEILNELKESCTDCDITYGIIDMQSLQCLLNSPAYMVYSARLKSSSNTHSGSLVSVIEEWVKIGPSLNVTGVLMTVHAECIVVVSSLNDTLCAVVEPIQSIVNNIIAISIIAGVLVIIVIVTVAVVVICRYKRRCDTTTLQTNFLTYYSSCRTPKDILTDSYDEVTETSLTDKGPSVNPNSAYEVINRANKDKDEDIYDDIVPTIRGNRAHTYVYVENHIEPKGKMDAKDYPVKTINEIPDTEILYSSFKGKDITVDPNSAYEVTIEAKKDINGEEKGEDGDECIYDDIVISQKGDHVAKSEGDETDTVNELQKDTEESETVEPLYDDIESLKSRKTRKTPEKPIIPAPYFPPRHQPEPIPATPPTIATAQEET